MDGGAKSFSFEHPVLAIGDLSFRWLVRAETAAKQSPLGFSHPAPDRPKMGSVRQEHTFEFLG